MTVGGGDPHADADTFPFVVLNIIVVSHSTASLTLDGVSIDTVTAFMALQSAPPRVR